MTLVNIKALLMSETITLWWKNIQNISQNAKDHFIKILIIKIRIKK